jgi:hypothetical protein
MATRPAVDDVVEYIDDDFNILRVNIHTDFGGELSTTMDFSFSPEFILFDRNGEEIWRGHRLPSDEQLQLANKVSP